MALIDGQDSAMEQALRNPIVLESIFQNTELKGKILRQVCKTWNEIVLSIPKPKLTLWLRKPDSELCCDSRHFILFCNGLEPRLGRSIKQDLWCHDETHSEPPESRPVTSSMTQLNHICKLFCGNVQIMDLTVDDLLIPALQQIFHSHCPNLREITIRHQVKTRVPHRHQHDPDGGQEMDVEENNPPWPNSATPTFFARPHLKTLNFLFLENTTQTRDLVQHLINAAPHLTHLKVACQHYPDLRLAVNLKSLIIPCGVGQFDPESEDFSFPYLTEMLKGVADRLEILQFGDNDDEIECNNFDPDLEEFDPSDADAFVLPAMPKLVTFKNDMLDVFTCGDALQSIALDKMPSLKNLSISNAYSLTRLFNLIKNTTNKRNQTNFSGVTHLTIKEVYCDPSLIFELEHSFPNLETLDIAAIHANLEMRANWAQNIDLQVGNGMVLAHVLMACHFYLQLKHLTLDIPAYPRFLSDLVRILFGNSTIFEKLKTFRLRTDNLWDHQIVDDLATSRDGMGMFKELLKCMSQMESAIIYYIDMKESTLAIIQPFIAANKIPVEFRQWG